jgi:peptide/nickel transport system permease protein
VVARVEQEALLPAPEVSPDVWGESLIKITWRRFRHDRVAVGGLVVVCGFIILAVFAPLFARLMGHGPNTIYPSMLTSGLALPRGPNAHFWFGADQVGRDVFVRTIYGARTSLFVSIVGTAGATIVAVVFGIAAGYFGGWLDTVIARSIDIFLSLPLLLFAIGLSTVCSMTAQGCLAGTVKPGLLLVTGIIAVFTWPYIARVVRGEVIALKPREFVQAAVSLGASDLRIMFVDLLPNLAGPVVVLFTLSVPVNILFEAALSYLGVGVPQSVPSWGRMLSDATQGNLFTYAWWMMVFPGLFLVLATLSFSLVGDGLRDALAPRGRA